MDQGVEPKMAFDIMEAVRKGKVKKGGFQEGWEEAMRAHGTDITRRMYFIQFPIDRPAEVSCCVAVPPGSEGEYVETTAPMQAICIYHHGAYEELPAVGRQLLDYAKEHGLTPQGILRHTYLEGPPQHKDPAKFITQVILPIV